jgi:hypothetical protein
MFYLINIDSGIMVGSDPDLDKVRRQLDTLRRSDWQTYVIAEGVLRSSVQRETKALG